MKDKIYISIITILSGLLVIAIVWASMMTIMADDLAKNGCNYEVLKVKNERVCDRKADCSINKARFRG